MTKYTKSFWENQIVKYKSASAISLEMDLPYQTVRWHLNKHNVPLSATVLSKIILDELGQEQLQVFYAQMKSAKKVSEHLGVSRDMVLARLPRSLKKQNQCIKYNCNENFFNENNEQSFYWAGFIAADGCVKLKDKKYKQLSIELATKDRKQLETFKQHIEFEGPVFDKVVKAYRKKWNDGQGSGLVISSDEVFDSLARFNIVPRKTHIYTFPNWMVNHELAHHFIRGYFDGDGSVYWGKLRNGRISKQLYLCVRGTTAFLTTYREILEDNTSVRKRSKPIRINNGIGQLEYGGNGIVMSIREFLYRDATIYLQRKYDRFFHPDVKKNPKIVKESPG